MQIKVDAEDLGEEFAEKLWDAQFNANHAFKMYSGRGWRPWYGYTNGFATDPKAAGKYIQRSCWAVMNLGLKERGLPQVPSPYVRLGRWRLAKWAMTRTLPKNWAKGQWGVMNDHRAVFGCGFVPNPQGVLGRARLLKWIARGD